MAGISRDSQGSPVPWMAHNEIALIEKFLSPDWTVVEYGSGGSTLYFSKLVRQWCSVEHAPNWASSVNAELNSIHRINASVTCVPVKVPAVYSGDYPVGYLDSFSEYVEAIHAFPKPDAVLVDGRARLACMKLAAKVMGPEGCIFVHDFGIPGRERYLEILNYAEIVCQSGSLAVLRPKKITYNEY